MNSVTTRLRSAICACLLLLVLDISNASYGDGAFMTIDAILDAWDAEWGNINTFQISIIEELQELTLENGEPLDNSDGLLEYHRVEMTKDSNDGRYHVVLNNERNTDSDRFGTWEFAYNGKTTKQFYGRSSHTAFVKPGLTDDMVPNIDDGFAKYLLLQKRSSGLSDEKYPDGLPMAGWLRRNKERLQPHVRPQLEIISGETCHVIEMFKDSDNYIRIWLAHEKNMTPMKYEGKLFGVIRNSMAVSRLASKEIEGRAFWFPAQVSYKQYSKNGRGGQGPPRYTTYKATISSFMPNVPVTEEDFDFEFPDGTRVLDVSLGLTYVVGAYDDAGRLLIDVAVEELTEAESPNESVYRGSMEAASRQPGAKVKTQEDAGGNSKLEHTQLDEGASRRSATLNANKRSAIWLFMSGGALILIAVVIWLKRKSCLLRLLILMSILLNPLEVSAQTAISEIDIPNIKADNACGPRCILALMRLTGEGDPKIGIKGLYEILGKEARKPTSLLDVKKLAAQFGFQAVGARLTIEQLKNTDGYLIVPVKANSDATGDYDNPLHFILVREITEEHVMVVNGWSLECEAFDLEDFEHIWGGDALLISTRKRMEEPTSICKAVGSIHLRRESIEQACDDVWDFGEVDKGAILSHTFVIQSNEGEKVSIVKKSCACLTPELGRDIEGRPTVKLSFHVDSVAWQEAFVVVLTEPSGILRRYRLRAYGRNSYEVYPPVINLEAEKGEVVNVPVKLIYHAGRGELVDIIGLESSLESGGIGYEILKDEYYEEDETVTWKCDLSVNFDFNKLVPTSNNRIDAKLHLLCSTDRNKQLIPIKISARIGKDDFRLSRSRLFFLTSRSLVSQENQTVRLYFTGDALSRDVLIQSRPEYLRCALTKDQNEVLLNCQLSVGAIQKIDYGLLRDEIVLVASEAGATTRITLPVSVFVKK